jgi:hypothetical protein
VALNILQAHKQVILDLLDADNVPPSLVVLDGVVPDGITAPYVLLYMGFRTASGAEEPEKVSKEAPSDVLYATAYCHSVGGNSHASLAVAGRVRAALRGIQPVIAGRGECSQIGQADWAPTSRDETTGAAVFDTVDVWEFFSLPT